MKAIPTRYEGIRYRSRLEARWAMFFDLIGWRTEYEPFDANGYIPDFLIMGVDPVLVEVRPVSTEAEYRSVAEGVVPKVRGFWEHDLLVLGLSPLNESRWWDNPFVGLLGEFFPQSDEEWNYNPEDDWDFAEGMWVNCPGTVRYDTSGHSCGQHAISHSIQSYRSRPCGHYYGGHLQVADVGALRNAWRTACDRTQWRRS